jgi:predicted RNA methylase
VLRYLDVGCGGGILTESLARLRSTESVVGIDPTPQVLAVAMEHERRDPGLQGKLRYLNTTIDALDEALATKIPNPGDHLGVPKHEKRKGDEGKFDVVGLLYG